MKIKKAAFSLIELSIVILVIGILVIGITQGSRIMHSAKTSKIDALRLNSPIISMSDLLMWYDATSKDSYANSNAIKDGDTITTLKDLNPQSANKIDLTGTATYLESSINGLPAIDFNGSSQYLDSSISASTAGSVTIMAVVNIDNITALSGIVTTYGTWLAGSIHFNVYLNKFEVSINPGGGAKLTTPNIQIGKSYIVTVIIIPGGKTSCYVNSVAATPYANSGNVVTNLRISLAKWYNGTSNTRFFNGRIGEVVIFGRALKDNERKAVEDYLSKKWSIALQ